MPTRRLKTDPWNMPPPLSDLAGRLNTRARHVPIAVSVVVVLFFADFALLGYEAPPPTSVWLAKLMMTAALAWLASSWSRITVRLLLWVAMAVAIGQAVTVMVRFTGVAADAGLLLAAIYMGCAAVGALIGITALMVCLAGWALGSPSSR